MLYVTLNQQTNPGCIMMSSSEYVGQSTCWQLSTLLWPWLWTLKDTSSLWWCTIILNLVAIGSTGKSRIYTGVTLAKIGSVRVDFFFFLGGGRPTDSEKRKICFILCILCNMFMFSHVTLCAIEMQIATLFVDDKFLYLYLVWIPQFLFVV